jgi:catechol 2,3-dioxygenase-like lactoylglutathione lyase family enzyme
MLRSMRHAKLVPELVCSDIERSLAFYTDVLGFEVAYARPEERFAYLDREGAQLMLEEWTEHSWVLGEFTQPYGRGINLEIEVSDAAALLAAVTAADARVYRPIEDRWYRAGDGLVGNRQFVVEDPDGYLLRFAEDLGRRPL